MGGSIDTARIINTDFSENCQEFKKKILRNIDVKYAYSYIHVHKAKKFTLHGTNYI